MDNQMRDEDIFYSDDEFSDSEDLYQVGSRLHIKTINLFSRCRITTTQRLGGASTTSTGGQAWLRKPSTGRSTRSRWAWQAWAWVATFSTMTGYLVISMWTNIIIECKLVNSIVYLAETLNLKINFCRPTMKTQSAPKSLSYSSMAKKEPLQPIKPNIIKPKIPPLAIHRAEPKKPTAPCMRVAETALMAGYRYICDTLYPSTRKVITEFSLQVQS